MLSSVLSFHGTGLSGYSPPAQDGTPVCCSLFIYSRKDPDAASVSIDPKRHQHVTEPSLGPATRNGAGNTQGEADGIVLLGEEERKE